MRKLYSYSQVFFFLTQFIYLIGSNTCFGQVTTLPLARAELTILECEKIIRYRAMGGVPPYTYTWTYGGTVIKVDENVPFGSTHYTSIDRALPGTYQVTVTDSNGNSFTDNVGVNGGTSFVLNIDYREPFACEGESFANVFGEIIGGNPNFTVNFYNESGGLVLTTTITSRILDLNDVPAGKYLVEVIDASGCVEVTEIEILEVEPFVIDAVGGNVGTFPETCIANGGISFDAVGFEGTVRFRIRRSNGTYATDWITATSGQIRYNQLIAGDYVLEISDQYRLENCPEELVFVIANETLLAVTPTSTPITCFGETDGTISLQINRLFMGFPFPPANVLVDIIRTNGTVAISGQSVAIGPTTGQATFTGFGVGLHTIIVKHGGGDYPECTLTYQVNVNGPNSSLTGSITTTSVTCFGQGNGTARVNRSGGWGGPWTYLWSNGQTSRTATNLAPGNYSVTVTDSGGCSIVLNTTIQGPPGPIDGEIELLNGLDCAGANDGSARVFDVTGGWGGYTYLWSNGETTPTAFNLPSGTNTVTVRDAQGCEEVYSIVVPVPDTPAVTYTPVNPSCFGGNDGSIRVEIADDIISFAVTVNGVTQNGNDVIFNDLPAGQYEVRILYGGNCSITEFVDIVNPPQITLNENNLAINHLLCAGDGNGSISGLTASGGTGVLSFQWQQEVSGVFEDISGQTSLNLSNLSGGVYRIIVTDEKGCTIFKDYIVNEPAPLAVTPPVVVNVACFGELTGSVSFTISGGTAPYSYAFNAGAFTTTSIGDITINGLGASTGYFIEIRDANGCVVPNLNFDVTSLPPINITDIVITPETCFGQSNGSINIEISGGTGNLGVEWYVAGNFSTVISTDKNLINRGPGQYTVKVYDLGNNSCFAQQTITIPPTPELTLALDGPPLNVFCFGENTGAINIAVGGGTGDYTFEWTGPSGYTSSQKNINGLASGLYNVTVTDENGCFKELKDILISQPPSGIVINLLNRVEPKCHDSTDGRIEIQIGGGNPGYTIAWQKEVSPGVYNPVSGTTQTLSNIGAGTYKAIVTDSNGCTNERIIDLAAPAPLQVTLISKEDVSCFGRNDGRITINVTGGTGIYFFNWDHGFINQNPSNLAAGFYSVTVRDANGCEARLENIEIIQPDPLAINLVEIIEPSCLYDDASIEVEFVGWIPGLSYSRWIDQATNTVIAENQNIVNNLTPGFYRVEYSLSGACMVSQTYSVPGPKSPLKLFTSPQDATCVGQTGILFLSASGGVPGYTYYIQVGGVWQVVSNSILSGLAVGDYNVRVTDSAGCEDFSTITIDQPNPPIFDAQVEKDVTCFGGSDGAIRFDLYGDTSGITYQWYRRTSVGGKVPINETSLGGLIAGTYYLEITYAGICTIESPDYIITQPGQTVATPTVIQPVCIDDFGSFTLQVSGGSAGKNILVTSSNGYSKSYTNENTGVFVFDELLAGNYTWTVENQTCPINTGTFTIIPITKPNFNVTSQDISCFGANDGIIEIISPIVQGGRTFTVFINGVSQGNQTSFFNVAAGNYQIRIVDNLGCPSDPVLVTISQPERPLEITNLSVTNVNCFGGNNGAIQFEILGGRPQYRAVLTPSSGTPLNLPNLNPETPYTFSGLTQGTYTLEIWDLNDQCESSRVVNITQPAALNLTVDSGIILCQGGTTYIELTPVGGTQPYTYVWERFNTATSSWVTLPTDTKRLSNVAAGQYRYTVTEQNNCNTITDAITIADGAVVTLTYVANEILCYGESALVTLQASSGGSTNFTYFVNGSQIFGNQFQAKAGSYLVYAVDNSRGCISEDVVINMAQPAAPLSLKDYISEDLSCFESGDGIISLSLTGGTAPYTITFQGNTYNALEEELVTFTGLNANIAYNFSAVDANGCTVNIPPKTLAQPLPLQTNANFTSILCFGGTSEINLQITGGTRPYSISWAFSEDGVTFSPIAGSQDKTTLSGLTAGHYTYVVSDGGCADITETIIINQPSPVLLTGNPSDVSCFGGSDGSVVFTPSGGAFTNYRIFFNGAEIGGNTVSNLPAGTYNAFALSGTCRSETIQIVIEQPQAPVNATVNFMEEVMCTDDLSDIELQISGGNGGYLAYLNSVEYTVDPSGLIIFDDVVPGTYAIRVVDSKGCEWNRTITILNPSPIDIFLEEIINISCFEGSDGGIKVNISGGSGAYTYQWFNSSNQLVGTNRNLSGAPAGIYTLLVLDENNCEASRNFEILDTTPVDFTFTYTDVTCFGAQNGSITVQGTGGKPGYSLIIDGIQYPNLTVTGLRPNTYMVYIMDANGCISPVKEVVISQPTPLNLAISTVNVTCYAAGNGQAEVLVTGGTGPYNIRWSDGNTSANRTGLAPGNYEVVVTDANGCTIRNNVIITQPDPILIVDNVKPVNCFGGSDGSITLDISGGNGNFSVIWTNKDTGEQVGTGLNANNLIAGIYRATITDQLGCELFREFLVTQPAEPLALTPIISNVRCAFEKNGSIDLIVTGGTAPYTYSWSSGENTRNINGKSGGSYTVNVTDSKGCMVMETFVITEPQPLVIEVDAIDNVSCKFGNDGRIKLNISGGTGSYTIQWSNGMTGPEISGLRAGVYTVFIIDENSCFESIAYTVTEPAEALSVTGQSSVELCLFTDVPELIITVTGGTAPYTYAWSNGATTKDLLNIAPGSYTVVVTDAKGCITEGTFTVPPPTSPIQIKLDGKFAICTNGERGDVSATVTGGMGPYRFQWSNGATTSSITNLLPGKYSLTVSDRNGCTATEDFEIAPPLNLRISLLEINAVSCFGGNNGSITIAINGGRAPFKINWSHGLQDQTFASGLVAGVYTVTVEDDLGCITTAAYNIQEPEILDLRGTVQDSKCTGDNQGIISLNVSGGTAPYTYRWSNGANNRVLRNLAPGTYSVVVTDRAGCSTGNTYVVSEPDPLIIEGIHSEMLSCFGDRDGFININIRGGIQPYRISWSDNAQLETLNRSNLGAGTYTVRVVDDNGCVQVKTFEIKQPEELEARMFTRFDVNCETRELTGVAWVTIKGGTKDYEIFWNNGAQRVEETTFFEDGEIKVTVIDANGCMVEVERYVEMPVAFTDADFTYTVISIGTQGEILVNDPVQFHDQTFGQVIAWEWDFGDGTKSNEQNPMHTYSKPGTYTISLMTFDALGCVSKTQIVVEVVASYRILVPNAFTPNDDGLNDTFIPKMRGIEDFEMHIFNKWGELIYSAYSQEDAGWDGRLNGRISPNGNYVYKIIFKAVDGEKGSKTGVFTLVL